MNTLSAYRQEEDDFLGGHSQSPLTPFENRIKVPVRAGEMVFD